MSPDPIQDSLQAVFLHIHIDNKTCDTHQYILIVEDGVCRHIPKIKHSGHPPNIVACHNEAVLFDELIKIVRK